MMKKLRLTWISLVLLPALILAQVKPITGTITDESGQPLPAVTVEVVGKNVRTTTNQTGRFTIQASPSDSLVFSFVGFERSGVRVGDQTEITLSLIPSASNLEEVVISGYGIQTIRKNSTGASSKIDRASLEKTVPTNVSEVLQGRAAGVNIVSNDGSPGAGFSINIRGVSSITAGSQPLVVIDNIPFASSGSNGTNPLATINPNDIESIDILKDASATALYGVGASNGVIVITTKKGKQGKPRINFSAKTSMGKLARVLQTLDPADYAAYRAARVRAFAGDNAGLASSVRYPGRPGLWEILADPDASRQWIGDPVQHLKDEYGVTNVSGTDWIDIITQTPVRQFYDLDFSGATKEGTSYFASVGYAGEQGTIINSKFQRLSTRLNLDQKIGKVLSTGFRLQYANTQYDGLIGDWRADNAIAQANFLNPFINRDNILGNTDGLINNGGQGAGPESPEFRINNTDINSNTNWFSGNAFFTVKPLKWLDFTLQASAINEDYKRDYYIPRELREAQNVNGRVDLTNRRNTRLVVAPRMTIDKRFENGHRLNTTFVYEARKDISDQTFIRYEQFNTEVLDKNSIGSAQSIQSTPTYRDRRVQSYIGRAQYEFNQKYILTALVRIDQSSKFIDDNTGVFPAFSAAWNIKEEKWLKNRWRDVSTIKFRAGYGITGNDQIPDNAGLQLAGISTITYPFNNSLNTAVDPGSRFANRGITWEETTGINFGFDLGFLNDRITLSSNVYRNRTDGLLLEIQLPGYTGFRTAIQNVGSLENKGLEIEVASTNIRKKNFTWQTNFNVGFNKGTIISLGGQPELGFRAIGSGTSVNDVYLRVGDPLGIYYGTIQDGVINNDYERFNSGRKAQDNNTGEFQFFDIDGDGIINRNEYVPIAYTQPLHTGGFGNNITWKGFDLYLFMRWSYGNDVVNNNVNRAHYLRGDNNLQYNLVNDVWTRQAQANNYQSTGAIFTTRINSLFSRSELVEDGSFLRFETLRLGYNLPKKWINKLKMNTARLSVTAQNFALLTRYSWYDPEVNTGSGNNQLFTGLDQGAYPRSRWLTFGLDVGF